VSGVVLAGHVGAEHAESAELGVQALGVPESSRIAWPSVNVSGVVPVAAGGSARRPAGVSEPRSAARPRLSGGSGPGGDGRVRDGRRHHGG
jgi:hypothetical protein